MLSSLGFVFVFFLCDKVSHSLNNSKPLTVGEADTRSLRTWCGQYMHHLFTCAEFLPKNVQ